MIYRLQEAFTILLPEHKLKANKKPTDDLTKNDDGDEFNNSFQLLDDLAQDESDIDDEQLTEHNSSALRLIEGTNTKEALDDDPLEHYIHTLKVFQVSSCCKESSFEDMHILDYLVLINVYRKLLKFFKSS